MTSASSISRRPDRRRRAPRRRRLADAATQPEGVRVTTLMLPRDLYERSRTAGIRLNGSWAELVRTALAVWGSMRTNRPARGRSQPTTEREARDDRGSYTCRNPPPPQDAIFDPEPAGTRCWRCHRTSGSYLSSSTAGSEPGGSSGRGGGSSSKLASRSVVNMNALRAAVAPAVGPPHRDGRGPQRDVIGDYRTLERRHSEQ